MTMVHTLRQSIQITCYSLALLTLSLLPARTLQAAEVITTLPPLSSLVHWLDPRASVICLLPASADPHHFQLTPRQVESMQKATLLIRSSRDDGQWASLHTFGKTWDIWPSHQYISSKSHVDKDHHHETNNHAWLNPHAVAQILPQLAEHLIQVYPKHRVSIEKNLQDAQITLTQTWQQWQRATASLKLQNNGSIMQHPAWLDLFQALGIPVWTVLESDKHGQEHGPHVLEDALKVIQNHPLSLLIADKRHSQRTLSWLQRHHPESRMITLDALGSSENTWPILMQDNLELLQQP
ncbi:MAG: zinc ABC transporter substrate-binding protein [Zetaproteobacteria bacterium]|nr:zinc ABC transporter substrate-binding protein [Zetaproteobacteria bacterium]